MRAPFDDSPRLRRTRDLVLVVTFVIMAAYEAVEMRAFESPRGVMLPLAIFMHALQVAVVLAATYTVLRAWREKSAHEDALARMVEKVVFAQEEERRRVAFELHDGVTPLLVSAKQHVETGRDAVADDRARAEAELTRGAERLGQSLVEMRHVLRALRPSTLDAEGLADAVERSVREAARDAGWTVRFEAELPDAPLPAAVETAAFRIVQEALANAARHAATPSIEVTLRADETSLRVSVRDQGVGVDASRDARRGIGLASMRERAALLGGRCEILSDGGTRVEVELPLREPGEA
jgi:two-component system, NarL family, sensor kinase